MKKCEILELVSLQGNCAYNEEAKNRFKQLAMKFVRVVIKELGLVKGEYRIRYNPAGIAVSGDAGFITDRVYVDFNADGGGSGLGIMVRSTKNMSDWTGGPNHWYGWGLILAADNPVKSFAEFVRQTTRKE